MTDKTHSNTQERIARVRNRLELLARLENVLGGVASYRFVKRRIQETTKSR